MNSEETASRPAPTQAAGERGVLTMLATAGRKEQRRARRWGIFFKLLTFAYLFTLLIMFADFDFGDGGMSDKHTALVSMEGVIFEGEPAGADKIVGGLRAAYKDSNTAGIVLKINSPGGSAVQSRYIYNEIRRLRKKHPEVPLYAVVSDICASGGYYVAAAADAIYADKSSIIGSIGVRMDGFGFVDAIEKLGIERRSLTAGDHKALLDPFLPENTLERAHLQSMLDDVHQQFITAVKDGRGERLADDEILFTGLIWSGEQARKLGLVDDFGSPGFVAREVIGVEDVVDFTQSEGLLERVAGRVGTGIGKVIYGGLLVPVLR
ncbi:MAG: S49 family peptidase [Gammaproteobacteria bacterium]